MVVVAAIVEEEEEEKKEKKETFSIFNFLFRTRLYFFF